MKKVLFTLVSLFILFSTIFSFSIFAQATAVLKNSCNLSFPEKIHKPVLDPLPAATYSIGTVGYFPTIDSAFSKLSTDGIAGNVVLELIDDLYEPAVIDFGFFMIGPITGAGPNSRVTIKPAQNKNVTIQNNGSAVFLLLDVSYITFDGVGISGPTTLTIHAFEDTLYDFNDGIDFVDDCNNNVMQNITFIIDDTNRQSGSGFWFTAVGDGPDNNLIQNNFVKKAGLGLYIIASSVNYRGKDNIIRRNLVGSETDSLVAFGLCSGQCENTIIENNIVQNLKVMLSGTDVFTIGIWSENGYRDIIRNNIVCKLQAISSEFTAGILAAGSGGSFGLDIEIYNNMIYDIQSTSPQSTSRLSGIELWSTSNPKIYYNTVFLHGSGTNPLGSAALSMRWGNNSNVEAKNNIFVNTRNESPYCASSIYLQGTLASLNSDYNDLYYDNTNPNNCLVRAGGVDYMTLQAWQAMNKDLQSVTEMPHFITPYLHIDESIPTYLESSGTPIAGINTDFDGQTRHATASDIGADEFSGTFIPVELTSFTAIANGQEVLLSWSTETELNNLGFEVQRSLDKIEFSTLDFIKGYGTTTEKHNYSFSNRNLTNGKYYYRLKQIDFNGEFEYSDIIEIEWRGFNTYILEQNYPNPFNPSTSIRFGIQVKSNVKITIHNSIGEEVAVVLNEEKEPGFYQVEFSASGGNVSTLTSGVYFYRLQAGSFVETKKMLLLK